MDETDTGLEKNVHQIWLQGEKDLQKRLPKRFEWTQTIKETFEPMWKYRLWDNETILTFLKEFYPHLVSVFEHGATFAMKADIARYAIIQHFGGLYLDCDVEVLKPFSFLLERPNTKLMVVRADTFVESEAHMFGFRYNNCIFAAKKDHPLMYDMLNLMCTRSTSGTKTQQTMEVGYQKFSNFVQTKYEKEEGTLIISNTLLEPLNAINIHRDCSSREQCIEMFPSAFSIHHADGSWIQGKEALKNSIGKVYGNIRDWNTYIAIGMSVVIVILLILTIVGWTRK